MTQEHKKRKDNISIEYIIQRKGVDKHMESNWFKALTIYRWSVDLGTYSNSSSYEGYFCTAVDHNNVMQFEQKFKAAIDSKDGFEVAGEVCYWKNYGTAQSRNRITNKLLGHLENKNMWHAFIKSVIDASNEPTYSNFKLLRKACNQPRGFATPITFLSFYKPSQYPMVDKHIANWWYHNKEKYGYFEQPLFSQRKEDGWIQTYTDNNSHQNWEAYLAWQSFCNLYAEKIESAFDVKMRARDVEMAVWMAWKKNITLEKI